MLRRLFAPATAPALSLLPPLVWRTGHGRAACANIGSSRVVGLGGRELAGRGAEEIVARGVAREERHLVLDRGDLPCLAQVEAVAALPPVAVEPARRDRGQVLAGEPDLPRLKDQVVGDAQLGLVEGALLEGQPGV